MDEQKRVIHGAEGYHDKSQGIDIWLVKIKEILSNTNVSIKQAVENGF